MKRDYTYGYVKNQLIRLGHLKPELREHIRPLLREANKTARLSASEKAVINKDFRSKGLEGNGRFRTVGGGKLYL